MGRTVTGPTGIKGLLPAGTPVAHKTGTVGGVANDVGYVTLPDGRRFAVAIFTRSSTTPPPTATAPSPRRPASSTISSRSSRASLHPHRRPGFDTIALHIVYCSCAIANQEVPMADENDGPPRRWSLSCSTAPARCSRSRTTPSAPSTPISRPCRRKAAESSSRSCQFDSISLDKICVNKPVAEVAPLTDETFQPRASTPLIDAAYATIEAVGEAIASATVTPKVVICIQTDGLENASTEHTWAELNLLIKEKSQARLAVQFHGRRHRRL